MTVVLSKAGIVITASQVLALANIPIQVILAPSAGFYNNIINASVECKFGTTPYAVNSSGFFNIVPHGSTSPLVSISQVGLLDQNVSVVGGLSSFINTFSELTGPPPVPSTDLDGVACDVVLSTPVSAGDGVLYVTVYYTVEPVL